VHFVGTIIVYKYNVFKRLHSLRKTNIFLVKNRGVNNVI
jgi:hypothetical protein